MKKATDVNVGRLFYEYKNWINTDHPYPSVEDELFDVLANLRDQGMTVLLVDQMAALALAIADRAYVIESGDIVAAGSPVEIRSDAALERAYLGET